MLNEHAKLSANIFADDIEQKATRDGFGTGVIAAGRADKNVVVLCADLKESVRAEEFEKVFPDRFIEMGIAEQNMAAVGSGMAAAGKIPFITSYAAFNPGRNYEQIRTTIALNAVPVNVCGMHAGISVGPDGATHQMLEDIALMRVLPGMTVIVPGDAQEAHKAVMATAKSDGPVYLRFGRSPSPVFTTADTPFSIGKATLLWESKAPKAAILSTGSLSYSALLAAKKLAEEGIEVLVLHVPTVKPLDVDAIVDVAKRAGCIVTVEEHQIAGGFGSAVAECLAERHPVRIVRLGIQDTFGQSGSPDELLKHYKLDTPSIMTAVQRIVQTA